MIKEFKEFIMRGNVIDMAVGIIIGAAFSGIVNSFVKDIIMPPAGWLLGRIDFTNMYLLIQPGKDTPPPYESLAKAQEVGAITLNFGMFINQVINFLIVALAVFLLVKAVNRLQVHKPSQPAEPTTKECPYCMMNIPIKATRCPSCTSELKK